MKKKVINFFVALFLFVLILTVFRISHFGMTGLAIWSDDPTGFASGSFSGTFLNSTFVQLSPSQNSGTFVSQIFDAGGQADWNNISWISGACYGCALPNNGQTEESYISNINMSGNVLLAHFDESSGNSFADSSGNNNDGSCSGSSCPDHGAQGKFGSGLDFFPPPGRHVNFGNPSSLNNFANQITIEAWIKPLGGLNGGPSIIEKHWQNQYALIYSAGGGGARLRAFLNTGSNNDLTGSTVHTTGNWYHVVFTYNGSQMRLYTNGNLDGSKAASGNIASDSSNLLVGAGWNGATPSYFFDGIIDEVAIYNRALTHEEVRTRYLRGVLSMNLSVRSCDDSSCSGESFQSINITSPQDINVQNNQYFQYRASFSREISSESPKLYEVSTDYTLENSPPLVQINSPLNTTYNINQLNLSFSATDPDDDIDSCWYSLDEGQTNMSAACNENVSLSANQGTNSWTVYANDSSGAENSSSVTFFVDSVTPLIQFVSPTTLNGSLINKKEIISNITIIEDNIQSVTFSIFNSLHQLLKQNTSNESGIFINSTIPSDGVYYFNATVVDLLNNTNSTETFMVEVDSTAPLIEISEPSSNSVIGITSGIPLSYSAIDDHIDSCWYNINNGSNVSLPSCQNTTFNVAGNGNYDLIVFANDTLGSTGSETISFIVSAGAPGILLEAPAENKYQNTTQTSFVFTATDAFIDSCSLLGDFSGAFAINQTNDTIVSGEQSSFSLSLPEGKYKWAIYCNNTNGFESLTSNRTLNIDTTKPSPSIEAPKGTYNSFSSIPVEFTITDASPVSCSFNVTKIGLGVILSETISDCIPRDPIAVGDYGGYVFSLTSIDNAGNSNTTTSTFTVEFSQNGGGSPSSGSGGSSGGGGGGGGGGSIIIGGSALPAQVSFAEIEETKMKLGQGKIIPVGIANSGGKFLNKCIVETDGSAGEWITNQQVASLAPGQKEEYLLTINVPLSAEVRKYSIDVRLVCDELVSTTSFSLEVFAVDFDFIVLGSQRESDVLKINYVLQENAGQSQDIVIGYTLVDQEGKEILEGQAEASLEANERKESSLEIRLPKNAVGELDLQFEVSNEREIVKAEHRVSIPSPGGLTGLVALTSDENKNIMSGVGIIILIAILGYFVMKISSRYSTRTPPHQRVEKRLIELDLGGPSWRRSYGPKDNENY